jgi:hypothetical protein
MSELRQNQGSFDLMNYGSTLLISDGLAVREDFRGVLEMSGSALRGNNLELLEIAYEDRGAICVRMCAGARGKERIGSFSDLLFAGGRFRVDLQFAEEYSTVTLEELIARIMPFVEASTEEVDPDWAEELVRRIESADSFARLVHVLSELN